MSKLAKHLHLHRDTVTVENESPESTSPKAQDQHLGVTAASPRNRLAKLMSPMRGRGSDLPRASSSGRLDPTAGEDTGVTAQSPTNRRRVRDIFSRSKSPMLTTSPSHSGSPAMPPRQGSEVVGARTIFRSKSPMLSAVSPAGSPSASSAAMPRPTPVTVMYGSPTERKAPAKELTVNPAPEKDSDAQSDASSLSPRSRKLHNLFSHSHHSKDNSPNSSLAGRQDSEVLSASSLSPSHRRMRDRLSPTAGSPVTRESSEMLGEGSADNLSQHRPKDILTRAISHIHTSESSPKAVNKNVASTNFPTLEGVPTQKAVRQWFVWATREWRELDVTVQVMPLRFASGATYTFHFMLMTMPDGQERRCVGRQRRDGSVDEQQLKLEVITTATAQTLAERFNAEKPTIKINFLDNFLVRTADGKLWGVEPFLPGKHEVHSKKHGLPEVGDHNKNPQAFSHYTWEFTKCKLLIVGLSGAGDYFRDPIIHTHDGAGFGMYNAGMDAIQQFFELHWCNKVCNYFELEMHMAKKLERKVGDLYIGNGNTAETRRRLYIGDFVGRLESRAGAGTPEELTILGLDRRKYDRLVEIFQALDLNLSCDLDEAELEHVFEKASKMERNAAEAEAYFRFAERLRYEVTKRSRINFKVFVLCWTGNN